MAKFRKHRFKPKPKSHFNAVCILYFLAGTAFLVGAIYAGLSARDYHELATHGLSVQAHVEQKKFESWFEGNQDGPPYRLDYSFVAPDGATYYRTARVNTMRKSDWDAAGSTVTVKYLSRKPSINVWEVEQSQDSGPIALAAFGMGLIGLVLLATGIYTAFLSKEEYEKRTHWGT